MREVPCTVEGQISLQNKLIDHLSVGEKSHVNDLREGLTAITMVLNEKRVLVVLDDVDNVSHLHALMSRIDV